jgi:hypothetical protein
LDLQAFLDDFLGYRNIGHMQKFTVLGST